MFENLITGVQGFVNIKDKETGEILAKSNAVHYGNITAAIATALTGGDAGHITYMAFGNGGTTIDASGVIVYKDTNTSELGDTNATLYNTTYGRLLDGSNVATDITESSYADIVVSVTLVQSEPPDQDLIDTGNGLGEYIFDEIALWSGVSSDSSGYDAATKIFTPDEEARMITHVIFHPVQKAANRIIEIEYTLRIQMGTTV